MRIRPSLLFCAAVLVGAGGCASHRVRADSQTNPARAAQLRGAHSWAWREGRGEPERAQNAQVAEAVEAAVSQRLAERGLVQVTDHPDFLVDYHAVVESRVKPTDVPGFHDPGWNPWRSALETSSTDGAARPSGTGGGGRPTDEVKAYNQGTLVLEAVDAQGQTLLWRGTAQRVLSRNLKPDRIRGAVDEAVKELVEELPVGR